MDDNKNHAKRKPKSLAEVFSKQKPLIAMLHLKGDSHDDIVTRAKREIEIYKRAGIDGMVVENYFGTYYQMEAVLAYLKEAHADVVYGVNCLNHDAMGFHLARKYDAKFVQLDSVVGHVKPRDEATVEAFLEMERGETNALVFGGVRFKYQPVLSEKSVEEDLAVATERCDAVVVTGNATGEQTSLEKIQSFRETLGDFPLIVGAGVTPQNLKEQLDLCDGAIVGSYLKEGHEDLGEVNEAYVVELVEAFASYRKEYGCD